MEHITNSHCDYMTNDNETDDCYDYIFKAIMELSYPANFD